MAVPISSLGGSLNDYGNESGHFKVNVVAITAGNYAAQTALYIALFNAIAGVTIGNLKNREIVASLTHPDVSAASSNLAQRENKWLIRYHDTAQRKFVVSLPTADLSQLTGNSEFLDISTGAGATLKTAFEAVVVSPIDESAVTMDSVQFVGRNS